MNKKLLQFWQITLLNMLEGQEKTYDTDVKRSISRDLPLEDKIIKRAVLLTNKHGFSTYIANATRAIVVSFIVLIVIGIITGMSTISSFTASNNINVYYILGATVFINLFMLLLWVIFVLSNTNTGNVSSYIFHKVAQFISNKLSKTAKQLQTLQALSKLMSEQRLTCTFAGLLTNSFWLIVSVTYCLCLAFWLSIKNFDFSWHSTIFTLEDLHDFATWLATPTSSLGIDFSTSKQGTAIFLLGTMFIYGVIPRTLCWAACYYFLNRKIRSMAIAEDVQLTFKHIFDSVQTEIVDHDTTRIVWQQKEQLQHGSLRYLLSIDIENNIETYLEHPGLLKEYAFINYENIDNRTIKKNILNNLSRLGAAQIMLVVDVRRSFDRSYLSLILELQALTIEFIIVLLHEDEIRQIAWLEFLQEKNIAYTNKINIEWFNES